MPKPGIWLGDRKEYNQESGTPPPVLSSPHLQTSLVGSRSPQYYMLPSKQTKGITPSLHSKEDIVSELLEDKIALISWNPHLVPRLVTNTLGVGCCLIKAWKKYQIKTWRNNRMNSWLSNNKQMKEFGGEEKCSIGLFEVPEDLQKHLSLGVQIQELDFIWNDGMRFSGF